MNNKIISTEEICESIKGMILDKHIPKFYNDYLVKIYLHYAKHKMIERKVDHE